MALNLTQITLESVGNCPVNTISTNLGTLSYATACIGTDTADASSVQCYSISTTVDSTCESILQGGINVDVGFECSNICQVSPPATQLASVTNNIPSSSEATQLSLSAYSSGSVAAIPPIHHPGFSTNPPFPIATYTIANTATNIYPSFIITFIALFFILFFVKK